MDTNENTDAAITKSIRFEPDIHGAIEKLQTVERRSSFNNMVDHLLATHPRVKRMLRELEQSESVTA